MTMTPILAELPEYQRYDCTACGKCCAGIFTVVLRPGEYERIQEQGWENEPALHGERLFVKHGKGHRLANRADGKCVFLNEQHYCRIHEKFGLEAKPLACQLYPFKLIAAGASVRSDIRFDCPAAAANNGRPVTAYAADVARALPQLMTTMAEPAPFYGTLVLGWPQLERITQFLVRLLTQREMDLSRRVVACIQASAILRHLTPDALEEAVLDKVLDTTGNMLVMTAAKESLERIAPSQAALTGFRQLLVVYAREDRWGQRIPVMQRYRDLFSMMGGKGMVPKLRADFPDVTFAALEEPIGFPPDDIVEPLERSLRVHLESLGFFGAAFAGYSYLDGLNALLLTYPVTFWFARAYAAGRGLPAPDIDCMHQALLLVNHVHGLATVFNFPLERYHLRSLCNPAVLSKLCLWYGR